MMATAFEVGEKFREKARQLLARANSPLPQQLREDLENVLEKPQPTVVSFNTLRELKKHLKDEGLSFVLTDDSLSSIYMLFATLLFKIQLGLKLLRKNYNL